MKADTPSVAEAPRLYLFDLDAEAARRDWGTLLPAGFHLVTIDDRQWRTTESDHRVANGIVVAHASSFDGLSSREQDGALEALARDNLYLILVAGGASQGEYPNPRVYRRRRFVGKSKVPDAGFRACFAEFWHHFEQAREPNFLLLEPLSGHPLADLDALCAGHVLVHLASGDGALEVAPALTRLGLKGLGSRASAVQERLAGQRDWFRSSASWAATLAGDVAGFPHYRELLAIELGRRYKTVVPPGIIALLDAITAGQPIAPALVAAAVAAFPLTATA